MRMCIYAHTYVLFCIVLPFCIQMHWLHSQAAKRVVASLLSGRLEASFSGLEVLI